MAQDAQGASAPVDTFRNFSCNPDERAMFRVATDLPISDVIDSASCYLAAALESALLSAEQSDREANYAVVYLIEMAKAAINSVDVSVIVQQEEMRSSRFGLDLVERLYGLIKEGAILVSPHVDKTVRDDARQFLSWAAMQANGGAQ